MSLNHKKLLKKKQKQKKKEKQRSKQQTVTPIAVHELPVISAWESDAHDGAISICFARQITSIQYHISMYLLDIWSLGVKDAYMRKVPFEQYKELVEDSHYYKRAEAGRLKKLLLDAVAFGRKNGFEPCGDYIKMKPFIKGISTENSSPHGMTFGKDGEVFYIANPETETVKQIKTRMATLEKTLGMGNFHFVLPDGILPNTPKAYVEQKMVVDGQVVDPSLLPPDENKKTFLATTTNELQMYARLYYSIKNFAALIKKLDKLKCVKYMDENTFHINYHKEAKNFGLEVAHKDVPKELFPIIFGDGRFRNQKTELTIDLRSYDRAVNMIEFIDKKISRKILYLNDIATYNEVMSDPKLTFDEVFSQIDSNPNDEVLAHLDELKSNQSLSDEERSAKSFEFFMQQMRANPLVTKKPVHFYKDGIKRIKTSLNMQKLIAQQHAEGNTDYTALDLIEQVVTSSMSKVSDIESD